MTGSFCTDEHVPSVLVTFLRSNGYRVETANDVFGEGTDDETLLAYCAEEGHLLITHDKKDFAGTVGNSITAESSSIPIRSSRVPIPTRRYGRSNGS